MRQNCHSILKWSLLTGTSTILLKLCYESVLRTATNRSMSTYEHLLTSWARTGQRTDTTERRIPSMTVREDLQLIGAQIYFRHGARTPLHLFPGLEEVMFERVYSISMFFVRSSRSRIPKNIQKVSRQLNGM